MLNVYSKRANHMNIFSIQVLAKHNFKIQRQRRPELKVCIKSSNVLLWKRHKQLHFTIFTTAQCFHCDHLILTLTGETASYLCVCVLCVCLCFFLFCFCQASVLSSKSEQHFTENTYLRFPFYFAKYYMIYWFAFTQDILMDCILFSTMYPYGQFWFSVIPLGISKDPRKLRPMTRKLRPEN